MPFLRVVRDKRGYETTYLIHSVRDGAQSQSRILYAFRSPGGVRVGRTPFEPELRREIEARNPGIAFDWDALVSGQQLIDAAPPPRRPKRKGPVGDGPPAPAPARRPDVGQPPKPRLVVPSAIEGDTPETQMRFLAHWHGILCEHLPERVTDAERRAALMTLVDKLNPAGWIDADEIAAGLQNAGQALEQLSRILAKRRRKSKRGGQRAAPPVGQFDAGDASAAVNIGEETFVEEPTDGDEQIQDEPDSDRKDNFDPS